MSKLNWILEKLGNIIFDVIAGVVLYLVLGGYISEPLSQVSPILPTLLVVSLVLSIVIGVFYRFFKSIKFHRSVEKNVRDLFDFLRNWDELHNEYSTALDSRGPTIGFEKTRALLQYNYPKISSVIRGTGYSYTRRTRGMLIRHYDIIGNTIANSPFTGLAWHSIQYRSREFQQDLDSGRTVLVSTIGTLDRIRNSLTHRIYWVLHLVPYQELENETEV